MASATQPLLDTSKKTSSSCKTFFFAFAFSAFVFSAILLVPNIFKVVHNELSSHENLCAKANDPIKCQTLLSEVVASNDMKSFDGISVLKKFLRNYVYRMQNAVLQVRSLRKQINDHSERRSLAICLELMDLSIEQVRDSILALAKSTSSSLADAHTWLSSVLTNHVTCLDELNSSSSKGKTMGRVMEDLISRGSASLGIFVYVLKPKDEMLQPLRGKFPSWISPRDRILLESSVEEIKADLVVAKDGSGNYETLAEAVDAVPDLSNTRFVIHIKRGIYEENVNVTSRKRNVMIVGDGMDSTVLTGSLNAADGVGTFDTPTLIAVGNGFILQDIRVQNTAGPEGFQAVALRVGADKSVINRCHLDAYQDTLYPHSNRQFYRDCYVIGTIDFIFGNAAVVLQNCHIVARKPMSKQKNMVTAQGRSDPNQNTGTSIQFCNITASEDLEPVKDEFPSYLGRPWRNFSRTAVMQSCLGDLIHPQGWYPWDGDFALDTLYYAEYMNVGPGSNTSERVDWPGYHVLTHPAEAMPFTVKELIQGDEWLDSTGVDHTDGL